MAGRPGQASTRANLGGSWCLGRIEVNKQRGSKGKFSLPKILLKNGFKKIKNYSKKPTPVT